MIKVTNQYSLHIGRHQPPMRFHWGMEYMSLARACPPEDSRKAGTESTASVISEFGQMLIVIIAEENPLKQENNSTSF